MVLQISVPHNTVLMFIGPSNSGKSKLRDKFKNSTTLLPHMNVVDVSSDECRREILGAPLHKYDARMMQASPAAFDLLFFKMKMMMSFPMSLCNSVLILDSTGLNEAFRNEVASLCKKMHWNLAAVVFDYERGVDEYIKFVPEDDVSLNITRSHLKRLRTKVRPTLSKDTYNAGVYIIKEKLEDFSDVSLEVVGQAYELNSKCASEAKGLSKKDRADALVIGDVHGCYQEMIDLILLSGFTITEGLVNLTDESKANKIVFVGDLIDKGPHSDKVVEFIYTNLKEGSGIFEVVMGNHDYFFQECLNGRKTTTSIEKRTKYYDSTISFGRETADKMLYICSKAVPYFFTNNFIVTHSPCNVNYLGKTDGKSLDRMNNFRYPRMSEDQTTKEFDLSVEKSLSFMKQQEETCWPYIISGHVQVSKVVKVGSQLMIDTGCVYGNKLTGVLVYEGKYRVLCVTAKEKYADGHLPDIFKPNALENAVLSPIEKRRLREMTSKYPVNFVSGTMAPSSSNVELNTLESVGEALSYYKAKGQKEVVLQTKWMGSRATFYMVRGTKFDERPGVYQVGDFYCYWISRNGYLISHVDLAELTSKMVSNYLSDSIELLLLDGELTPWSLLGQGLISGTYLPVMYGLEESIKEYEDIELYDGLLLLKAKAIESGFMNDIHLPKAEKMDKYKQHEIAAYEGMLRLMKSLPNLEELKHNLDVFKKQIELYGSSGEPNFYPFCTLKVKREGREEVLPYDCLTDTMQHMSHDSYRLVQIDDLSDAEEFFNSMVSSNMEGIVVKPMNPHLRDVAPYIKVRNPDYLSLVYGPNYRAESTYRKHVASKSVSSKMRSSIKQWNYALDLLNIPYSDISSSEEAKSLIYSFIKEEDRVGTFDPRL